MKKQVTIAGSINFKKDFKKLYAPSAKEVQQVDVPDFQCLMVDGSGHPGKAADFQDKIGLLYGLAYTLKFLLKAHATRPLDFSVAPMGCQYYADDPSVFSSPGREKEWRWTLLIPIPLQVNGHDIQEAKKKLHEKKAPANLGQLRIETLEEGTCVQIMHIGPYEHISAAYERLFAFISKHGYEMQGRCQEIYLSDPRRAQPERLKTIVRVPIR